MNYLKTIALAILLGLGVRVSAQEATRMDDRTVSGAAQIEEAPSPEKQRLIRRFLELNGTQSALDSGSLLDPYAAPGSHLAGAMNASVKPATVKDLLFGPIEALHRAYQPRKAEFQEAYESHVNWEFSEQELAEIVAFLETAAGEHFMEGRWRMDAYTNTSMEDVIEEIVADAERDLRNR